MHVADTLSDEIDAVLKEFAHNVIAISTDPSIKGYVTDPTATLVEICKGYGLAKLIEENEKMAQRYKNHSQNFYDSDGEDVNAIVPGQITHELAKRNRQLRKRLTLIQANIIKPETP